MALANLPKQSKPSLALLGTPLAMGIINKVAAVTPKPPAGAPALPVPKQRIPSAPPAAPESVSAAASAALAPNEDSDMPDIITEGSVAPASKAQAPPAPVPVVPAPPAAAAAAKPRAAPKPAAKKDEPSSSSSSSSSSSESEDERQKSSKTKEVAKSSKTPEPRKQETSAKRKAEPENKKKKTPAAASSSKKSTERVEEGSESESSSSSDSSDGSDAEPEKPAPKKAKARKQQQQASAPKTAAQEAKELTRSIGETPRFEFTIEKTPAVPIERSKAVFAARPPVSNEQREAIEKHENGHRSYHCDMTKEGYAMWHLMSMAPADVEFRRRAAAEAEQAEAEKAKKRSSTEDGTPASKKNDANVAVNAYIKRLSEDRFKHFDVWYHEGRNQAVLASDFRAKEWLDQNPLSDSPTAYASVRYVLGRVLSRTACGTPTKASTKALHKGNIVYYTNTVFTEKSTSSDAGSGPDNKKWVPDILFYSETYTDNLLFLNLALYLQ